MAVDKVRLFGDTVRALSLVLDWHEGEQLLHAWRVGFLARAVARELGAEDPSVYYIAGLLHDIGALGNPTHVVEAALLGFPDATDREHPAAGVRILRPLRVLERILPLIADHHERLDGGGFPRGKRGAEIAPGAEVVSLADRVELCWRRAAPPRREAAVRRLLQLESGRAWPARTAAAALALLDRSPELLSALDTPAALRAAVGEVGEARGWVDEVEPVELVGQLLWLFPRVVEAKHPRTLGHSARVTAYARRIARRLGEDAPSAWDVVCAGLLHDVGMAAVPRALVAKETLSEPERGALLRHARETHTILSSIRDLSHLATPAATHHERYDGRGRPFGLAREEIPLLGRILALADAYDVSREGRPGRAGVGHRGALQVLRDGAGTRFDPHLAEVAISALDAAADEERIEADLDGLRRLLEEDAPDLRHAVAMAVAAGAPAPAPPSWRVVEFDPAGAVVRGREAFGILVGRSGLSRLEQLVDPEIVRRLPPAGDGDEDATAPVALVDAGGEALEAVLRRRGAGFELLFRATGSPGRTVERMARFHRNFVAGSEAAFFADAEGRVVDASAGFLDLYGLSRPALVGRTPPVFDVAPEEGPGLAGLLAMAHQEAGAWIGEVTTVRADGARIPALVTVTLVHDGSRVHAGYAFRVVDISARLRLEQELAAKAASLEAAVRLKGELVAIASHDLKAPVAAMMSHARLLATSLPTLSPAAAAARLDLVVRLGQRGLALIDRMLCLEKIESGTLRLRLAPLRLDELVEACVEGLAPVALERGVSLAASLARPLRIFAADRGLLAQVLDNLVSNAVRHAPPASAVEVSCRDEGDLVRCEVADAGPGVAPEERERIFDRYQQGAAGQGGGGVGLGLYVTRTVVGLHGGRVWVEAREGGGSRFVVELPTGRAIPATGRARVLLLDPEGTLATAIEPLLAGRDVETVVLRDWVEVARMAAALDPDLLVARCDPALVERAARAAPACPLVAVRAPADGAGPAGAGDDVTVLELPVMDVELAGALRDARRKRPRDTRAEEERDRRRATAGATEGAPA